MFAALKERPVGRPLSVPVKRSGSDVARMEVPDDGDVFNFSFLRSARIPHYVFYVVSRAIAQMIDREETCGTVSRRRTYTPVLFGPFPHPASVPRPRRDVNLRN